MANDFAVKQPDLLLKGAIRLADTLESGQAFRWQKVGNGFCGVIGQRVVWLRQRADGVEWQSTPAQAQAQSPALKTDETGVFLAHYLGLQDPLDKIVATFPDDPHLRAAVCRYYGLRLLRQDPWEVLASFIASSAKQIVQIRQIVAELCQRLGKEIPCSNVILCCAQNDKSQSAEALRKQFFSFPSPERVASASHQLLWNCKLGFRAQYLLATARMIGQGKLDLSALAKMETARARQELTRCPGVGEKIANCTLLFGYGRQDAFPIDVWMERTLRRLYFDGKRNVTPKRLREFAASYFGPYAGYAQQYLFHYVRMTPQVLSTRTATGCGQ